MCGLAGALLTPGAELTSPVRRMCQHMRRRGPDAEGEWFDPDIGVGLGHRRLSIIDLDARANQPFATADGRHRIAFNGEIYNYRELGKALEADGVRLRTTSDTEVILELYRQKGLAAFRLLRGMFALAIWDAERSALVLARDPYGIKPLYVAQTSVGVLFASQVKALMASGLVSRTIDNAGVAGFYIWGSVPEPFTTYQDVRAVPAGAVMTLHRDGRVTTERYADVATAWSRSASRPTDIAGQVREAMESSVRAHLVADVPAAVLLSGGVDSGAIAGLMSEHGQAVEGVTIAFSEFTDGPYDEVPRAREIAAAYGVRQTIRTVGRAEFVDDVPRILEAMDQPSIDGVNTWFAAKAVAERGFKVALSGIGGDEIFCGYETFRTVPQIHRLARRIASAGPFRGVAAAALGAGARLSGKPKVAGISIYGGTLGGAYMLRRGLLAPHELASVMAADAIRDGLERLRQEGAHCEPVAGISPIEAIATLESTRYLRNQLLRDSDWASMAHSLELRTPLVDWELLQSLAPFAASFASGAGKRMLADAPQTPLPGSIASHRKTGFALPIAEWLSDGQREAALPPAMRRPWARRWASQIAERFGFAAP